MIEIVPMDESYVHTRCLHSGPVDTAVCQHADDPLPEGHPSHPWSDETLHEVIQRYRTHGISCCPPPAAFSRELMRRYGTCAILAWEGQKVVGQLFFYPMRIARMLEVLWESIPPLMPSTACDPEEGEGILWVLCVMSSRPYLGSQPDTITGCDWPTVADAGARRGVGQRLVGGLIDWAREHDWRRIVKVAHADVDCFYGQLGGGGKAFWKKAGFEVAKSTYFCPENWKADFRDLAESQGQEKGMTAGEVWTWHRMRYDF